MNNDRIKIEVLRKEIEVKNNQIERLDDLVNSLLNEIEELKNKPKIKVGIGVKK
jgi:hypothetical protein|tara:strand:+ start:215 stop:376 length:162 start_codon:yes stop_codon:yes gene_type:complete